MTLMRATLARMLCFRDEATNTLHFRSPRAGMVRGPSGDRVFAFLSFWLFQVFLSAHKEERPETIVPRDTRAST
jgi:hypothetical protein